MVRIRLPPPKSQRTFSPLRLNDPGRGAHRGIGLTLFGLAEHRAAVSRDECSLGFRPVRGHGDAGLLRARTTQHMVHPGIRGIVWPRFRLRIPSRRMAVRLGRGNMGASGAAPLGTVRGPVVLLLALLANRLRQETEGLAPHLTLGKRSARGRRCISSCPGSLWASSAWRLCARRAWCRSVDAFLGAALWRSR
jgi:hypothetical protein